MISFFPQISACLWRNSQTNFIYRPPWPSIFSTPTSTKTPWNPSYALLSFEHLQRTSSVFQVFYYPFKSMQGYRQIISRLDEPWHCASFFHFCKSQQYLCRFRHVRYESCHLTLNDLINRCLSLQSCAVPVTSWNRKMGHLPVSWCYLDFPLSSAAGCCSVHQCPERCRWSYFCCVVSRTDDSPHVHQHWRTSHRWISRTHVCSNGIFCCRSRFSKTLPDWWNGWTQKALSSSLQDCIPQLFVSVLLNDVSTDSYTFV